MMKKIFWVLTLLLGLIFTFGSEDAFKSNLFTGELQAGEPLKLAYTNWDTEVAATNVIAEVLRQEGFNVTITPVEVAPMFEAVASGQSDALVAAWLPNTHAGLYEENADRLVDLGPNLEGARPGLVVPAYM